MLPIETDTLTDYSTKSCMIEQIVDNNYLCNSINPNSKKMTTNEFANPQKSNRYLKNAVNKSYELSSDIIQESYFDIDGLDDEEEFMQSYAEAYPKGVILVLNECSEATKSALIVKQLEKQLKQIIVCDKKSTVKSSLSEMINVNSLELASKKAYDLATNGQAILFHGVGKNFDLFSHIF